MRTCYLAAALFNGRETAFNIALAERLERRGQRCLVPQRDGFEFAALHGYLAALLPESEVPAAVQQIIYHLDLGWFLPNADHVLALVDEPLDEGVVVEISYARLAAIPVVGLRTDVRSPYGEFADPCGGAHFFPVLQCDAFIHAAMPNRSLADAERDLDRLAAEIEVAVEGLGRHPAKLPPAFSDLVRRAELLFADIDDLQGDDGLRTIAERFVEHRDQLKQATPRKVVVDI